MAAQTREAVLKLLTKFCGGCKFAQEPSRVVTEGQQIRIDEAIGLPRVERSNRVEEQIEGQGKGGAGEGGSLKMGSLKIKSKIKSKAAGSRSLG